MIIWIGLLFITSLIFYVTNSAGEWWITRILMFIIRPWQLRTKIEENLNFRSNLVYSIVENVVFLLMEISYSREILE